MCYRKRGGRSRGKLSKIGRKPSGFRNISGSTLPEIRVMWNAKMPRSTYYADYADREDQLVRSKGYAVTLNIFQCAEHTSIALATREAAGGTCRQRVRPNACSARYRSKARRRCRIAPRSVSTRSSPTATNIKAWGAGRQAGTPGVRVAMFRSL